MLFYPKEHTRGHAKGIHPDRPKLADAGALIWRKDMSTPGSVAMRGPVLVAAALTGVLALQGCAEYRVSVPDSDPIQLEGQESEYVARTVDAYFWGSVLEPQVVAADCEGEGINDVVVQRTGQQDLISVLTLGIWMPSDVRYRCNAPPATVVPEPKPR
jgi:Bor protein